MKARLIMLLLTLLVLGACSGDDETEARNEIILENVAFPLNQFQYDEVGGPVTNFTLTFYPYGNHTLSLRFKNLETLPDGKYTLMSADDPAYDPMRHFFAGSLYFEPTNQIAPITEGTVRMTKSGEQYKITFDVDTYLGRATGQYKGTLIQI